MPRLTHPTAGTVVHVEGSLADEYKRHGWQEEGAKPAPRRRGRPKPERETDD